jgi:hypothetical protein
LIELALSIESAIVGKQDDADLGIRKKDQLLPFMEPGTSSRSNAGGQGWFGLLAS